MPDEMISIEMRVDAALGAMAEPPFVASDVAARVAARAILAGVPAARPTHRTMRIAAMLAVVAVGAAALSMSRAPARPTESAPVPAAIASATPARVTPVMTVSARPIVFELDAPTAHSVQVLGDFNQWSRSGIAMERGTDGRWRVTTMLPPGRYVYAFLVDGRRFRSDPARDAVEDRDFGVTGSELVVGEAP
jgi:hypothetical protein